MCMDGKAALLVMNLGVQREENEQCVSTACASSERSEHPAGIRRPLCANMYSAIGDNVVLSCKGQRYRAKGIVAETSRLCSVSVRSMRKNERRSRARIHSTEASAGAHRECQGVLAHTAYGVTA